ncbi:MAG: glutamate racemase [Candidatus Riflebacteria bacterium]|nr:glutamate racemase [Candidatus Riflebacteria bacterium]
MTQTQPQPGPIRSPIGVFDSGIGGLTVLRALLDQLPCENYLYLGDTAKVPYGNKSPSTITRFAHENTLFLLQRGVKAVVVACNTVSATCLDQLTLHFRAPIVGVIEPAVQEALRKTRTGQIGVIGTAGTIATRAYDRAVHRIDPGIRVVSVACPLFVPIVESDFVDHDATALVVREYLEPVKNAGVDTLILACTHYPLIKRQISAFLGPEVTLVDSGPATAAALSAILRRDGALSDGTGPSTLCYCLTDSHPQFRQIGERVLGRQVHDVEVITL